MPRAKNVAAVPLETIWEVPDELWERLGPILERRYPRKPIGRPRADLRRVVNGVIFRLRTGCQWNQLPRIFGDDATVHRWFQRFLEDGVLEELWARSWFGSASSWGRSTGAGRPPTARWARRAWAAQKGAQPH